MSDKIHDIAFDESAPEQERFDANAELSKSHLDLSSIIPSDEMQEGINQIIGMYQEQDMMKARGNIIPFPGKHKKPGGMQSVHLDDFQIFATGEYFDKQGSFNFDSLRTIVDQTPVLSAVVLTRIRQVARFTRPQENENGTGFVIRHKDKEHELNSEEQQSINELTSFFSNCGWESNPRRRQQLKRKSFAQFSSCFVRDSLVMDSSAIETEVKRDPSLGMDGFYNVDGSTIRLCSESGYEGNDEVFALQVVQGRIRTAYTYNDLIYVPRNPRTDVGLAGYGQSEVELMIRVVTGFLNAMTYNIKGFDENAIPKGMLHLSGDYDVNDLAAFKRYWNAMVKGVNNQWSLPVMISKDQESKASFEKFGVDFDEMYFSKWMTFLTSIICAIYGMSPDEINFESFSSGKSALSGDDTAEKLADSKDKGLRPLMSYMEDIFTGYILNEFSDKYVFRWAGLDPQNEERRFEVRKLTKTINELRAEEGDEALDAGWGDAPANPSLIGAWQQENEADQPEDFGQAEGEQGDDTDQEDLDTEQQGAQEQTEQTADFGKAFPIIYTL